MKHTYSMFCTPTEVIKELLPHKYPMELNRKDMLALLYALEFTCSNSDGIDEEDQSRLLSLRSSILETIGIEEV